MFVIVVRNRLATKSLSEDYIYILHHLEHTLSITVCRFFTMVWRPFEMHPALSQLVVSREKLTMTHIDDLLTVLQIHAVCVV